MDMASSSPQKATIQTGDLDIHTSVVLPQQGGNTPTPPPNPTPDPKPSPSTGGNIGPDGVMQIYPDKNGGTQVYMKDNPDPKIFNVSYGTNSHIPYTKKQEGKLTYFETAGSPITYHSGSPPGRSTRIDTYPGGGMWSNKTTYSWKSNPGYLYNEQGIKAKEYTTFIRTHKDLGTHQAYAHKLGGRDDDTIRSLAEMVYPTATHGTIQFNYNYAHFPYVHANAKQYKDVPKLTAEKWVGVKTCHWPNADGKSSHWEMWYNENPFDAQGNPTTSWEKIAEYEDKGCKEYGNVPLTWKCHKDVCRVDGFGTVDFALFSDREIDPTAKPNITPKLEKLIQEQSGEPAELKIEENALLSVEEVQEIQQQQK